MTSHKLLQFRTIELALVILCLGFGLESGRGATLINFPFNEGTNIFVHDTAQGLLGSFGPIGADPAIDTVALTNDSPSGVAGDGSFVNNRSGFLMADDSATQSLDITNGPITMEGWIKVNPNVRQNNEGIVSYGNSYKLGFRNRILTFTLLGIVDIGSPYTNSFPVDEWVHVAAAWTPGVGVNFYITSASLTTNTFKANTANLAARPVQHNYISVGSEGFVNALDASFDRVKIHNRALQDTEIDNDAANPKASYPETKVAYDFNESAFPSTNTVSGAPVLPLTYANPLVASFFAPVWTNDTPSGLSNDFALAFNLDMPTNRQKINLDFSSNQINFGAHNTNYTLEAWVKLPTTDNILSNRMIVLRTSGAGPRVSLSINTNRALWTTIYGNTDFKSAVIVPNDLAWHHIAVVMTNFAQAMFYLDGALSQTMNRTATGVASTAGVTNLLIGVDSDTQYFRGLIDRIRISDSALSIGELDSVAIPQPKLAIQPNGDGTFTLSWPATFTDFVLESAASIPSANWTNETYGVTGNQNTATISISTQSRFYRLRR